MKIQLKNTRVEKLNFVFDDSIEDDDFSFAFANGFVEEDVNFFVVKFDIKLTSTQGYRLELEYVAEFNTDEPVNIEFKESMFPIVNAPAIAYPYLRSYVSIVTLNSGYEPIILPTVNFQSLASNPDRAVN
ncbi:protein-export chaperone SecB [Photobacterium sp. WH24]|uniref:protein-export chaperone SecB n=1 Tax=Photobacterium sp. WH24 TaxID=2827237 RepID=UPI001C43BE1F|nr:protein-export chaperone SecB [Photobacterium sp. WH24]MBV7264438.1 protein-export chaperone SecB [Photobacterium sp. WH24]